MAKKKKQTPPPEVPPPALRVTMKQSENASPEALADLAEFVFAALKRVRERRKREAEAQEHHGDAD